MGKQFFWVCLGLVVIALTRVVEVNLAIHCAEAGGSWVDKGVFVGRCEVP